MPMPPVATAPQKILVVDFALLGDLVLGLRALKALATLPQPPQTWWVVNSAYADLVATQPGVAGVLGIPKYQSRARSLWRAAAFARRVRPQLSLVMHDSFFAALLARPGGGVRVGYAREGRGWLLTHALPRRTGDHLWTRRERLLQHALGISTPPGPWLGVAPAWREALGDLGGAPYAVVNINASWPNKCYPVELYAQALARVRQQHPGLRWLAIATQEELPRLAALQQHAPWVTDAGRLGIGPLAALLQRARLLLTNDSGPMHLAQAVGCPVVALFGPTDPAHCGPIGQHQRVLRHPLPCGPCYRYDGCPHPAAAPGFAPPTAPLACLTNIAPHQVALACGELLQEASRNY